MERFGITDVQATAIVSMRLGQLSGMERIKIETELDGLYAKIRNCGGHFGRRRQAACHCQRGDPGDPAEIRRPAAPEIQDGKRRGGY